MTRKSSIITLCIIGAIAAVGSCACCLSNWHDKERKDGQGGHVRHHRTGRGFIPIFFGGGGFGGSHPSGGHVGTGGSSSTSRGGFGSSSHGSGGSHGGGSVGG